MIFLVIRFSSVSVPLVAEENDLVSLREPGDIAK